MWTVAVAWIRIPHPESKGRVCENLSSARFFPWCLVVSGMSGLARRIFSQPRFGDGQSSQSVSHSGLETIVTGMFPLPYLSGSNNRWAVGLVRAACPPSLICLTQEHKQNGLILYMLVTPLAALTALGHKKRQASKQVLARPGLVSGFWISG